jgi:MoaA/NifB/PqqE/SkfB family radical SAM enzyme
MKSNSRLMNIQIQTTSCCNATCIMCPYPESWHKKHPGIMTDAIFSRIIGQIRSLEIDKICPYLQNDPFMDKKIFSRIKEIIERISFKVLEISTNANSMDHGNSELLADIFKNVSHDIWLSFHGVDSLTYENIMGLNFDRCLEHIIHLLKVAQDIPLNIAIVGAGKPLNKKLRHEFNFSKSDYLEFWERIFRENNIRKRPRVVYFKYHDRAGTIQRNSINMKKIIRQDLTQFYCPRVDQWLHFLYNGELVLCCDDYHREQVFGNIRTSDLDEILRGAKYQRLKAQVLGQIPSSPDFICKRCINPGG